MRTTLLSLFLLCCAMMSAQNLEFAMVNGEHVRIRQSPSTSAPLLVSNGYEPENELVWSKNATVTENRYPYYLQKYDVAQVVGHAKGWTKVKFFVQFGFLDKVSRTRYVEGWMSNQFLKSVSPVNLTWDNFAQVKNPSMEKMVNTDKAKKTVFIVGSLEGSQWLQYGKVAAGRLEVYGNDSNVFIYDDDKIDGTEFTVEKNDFGNQYVIKYGKKGCYNDILSEIDMEKCPTSVLEKALTKLDSKLVLYRYYFKVPEGYTTYEFRKF